MAVVVWELCPREPSVAVKPKGELLFQGKVPAGADTDTQLSTHNFPPLFLVALLLDLFPAQQHQQQHP